MSNRTIKEPVPIRQNLLSTYMTGAKNYQSVRSYRCALTADGRQNENDEHIQQGENGSYGEHAAKISSSIETCANVPILSKVSFVNVAHKVTELFRYVEMSNMF